MVTVSTSDADSYESTNDEHSNDTMFVGANSSLQQKENGWLGNFTKAFTSQISKIGNYVYGELHKIATHISGEQDKKVWNVMHLAKIGNGG